MASVATQGVMKYPRAAELSSALPAHKHVTVRDGSEPEAVPMAGVVLTQDGAEHGDGGEHPGQTLAAHEQGAVAGREEPDDAEQAALQHGAEHCGSRERQRRATPNLPPRLDPTYC